MQSHTYAFPVIICISLGPPFASFHFLCPLTLFRPVEDFLFALANPGSECEATILLKHLLGVKCLLCLRTFPSKTSLVTAPPYIWLYHICLNRVPVFQDVSPAGGIQMFTYSVQLADIMITYFRFTLLNSLGILFSFQLVRCFCAGGAITCS